MMLLRFSLPALGLAVAAAQEPLPPLPSLPDLPAAEEEQVDAAQEQAYREQIKAAEEHLLAGVQKLHELHRVLLGVKDADSAAAAVPAIIRLTGELHDWAAGFSGLPAPSPEDLARLQGCQPSRPTGLRRVLRLHRPRRCSRPICPPPAAVSSPNFPV